VTWFGPVTHKQAGEYYRDADVFILPTLSDGFAITQLEAQAYRLPIIASRRCGEVVQDHVNGLLLSDPGNEAIESAIRFCLAHPKELARLSQHATHREGYNISRLSQRLSALWCEQV
jgi:glycosyltransferase involved in cell wall biosynthesis